PDVAIRLVVPLPPSVDRPAMVMVLAVRLRAVPATVPVDPIGNGGPSIRVTLDVPSSRPATVRATPLARAKPCAGRLPIVAPLLVVGVAPARLAEPVALPDNVPVISVPVSLIVPAVAIRLVVPLPPSLTRPPMVRLVPVRLTAFAATVPLPVI